MSTDHGQHVTGRRRRRKGAMILAEALRTVRADRLAGAILRAAHRQADALTTPPALPLDPASLPPLTRRVLVRRERGLGDILFALSAVEAFHQACPWARIDFLTSESHAEWIRWFPFIDRVLTEPPVTDYEAVFDHEKYLEKNFPGERSVGMGLLEGAAPRRVVTAPAPPEEYRKRVRELGGACHAPRVAGAPFPQVSSSAGRPLLAFAPLAAKGTRTRSLPVDRIPEFVAALREWGTVALLHEQRVPLRLKRGVVNLTGRLSVAEVIALVGECDAFVGVDSGLLHVAAMFRKPVVGLFSHLEVTRRLTLAERFVALQPALTCFPCGDSWRWNVTRDGVAPPCRPEFRSDDPDQPPLDCLRPFTPRLVVKALGQALRGAPECPPSARSSRSESGACSHDDAVPCGGARTVLAVADGRIVTEWTPPPATPSWMRDEKTAVIILNHCTWRTCTRECLDLVLKHTAVPFSVILVDNGSSAAEYREIVETAPRLERKHRCRGAVKLARSGRNLGFPGGVNRALEEVDPRARYVCLLNSDCFIREPRWNERAARLFREDWRLGAVSLTRGEHRYFLDGVTGRDYFFPELDAFTGDAEMVNGACLVVDRSRVGDFRLDERYSPGSREDDDLCFQIRAQGWSVGQAADFDVVHERSATLRKKKWIIQWNGKRYDYKALLRRNRKKLLRKWAEMVWPAATEAEESVARLTRFYRPRVSVIMPTRDRLDIVDESVRSVLDQTLAEMELLIVAATKREAAALDRRYGGFHRDSRGSRRVTVLRQEGKGIAGARNTGMRAARGVYLAHLDDDEVWAPEHLATMIAFLDRYPHLALAYGDVRRCRGYFRRIGARNQGKGRRFVELEDLGTPWCRQFDFGRLVHGNWIPASAVVMRREVFETLGGFDESFRYADDWEYWLRTGSRYPVAHCCTIRTTGNPTVTYRLHGGNATQRDLDVWDREFVRVRERYLSPVNPGHSPAGGE